MAKQSPRRAVPLATPQDSKSALRQSLTRRKKSELVDFVMELAEADRALFRRLMIRLDVAEPPDELLASTRRAIADATNFDKRDMNRNFAYDYAAYRVVKRNFGRLIDSGETRQVMSLALELMKHGSYQVEMSDEGMMTSDIEDCLKVVINALKTSDLPANEIIGWCAEMRKADRVCFNASDPLEALRESLQNV